MRKQNTNTLNLHWREIPLVRLLLPFVVGIYLTEVFHSFQQVIPYLLLVLFIGLYGLGYFSFSFKKRWLSGAYISLLFLLLGYTIAWHQDSRTAETYFSNYLQKENKILGTVISYPKENKEYIRFTYALEGIQGNTGKIDNCTGMIQVTLKKSSSILLPDYGDQLFLSGNIQVIKRPKNPNTFDYREYLRFQNIHHQIFVDTLDWKILTQKQVPLVFQIAHSLQQTLVEKLKDHMHAPESFAIAAAMALGYKDAMTANIKEAYTESGAIHILAVSGLHVGILSEVLLFLFGFMTSQKSYWKWLKYVFSLIAIWTFVLLVGATDSVVRAGLLFSFINFGRVTRRDIHSLNALAAAAFIILIVDPYALFQVGFQFSFLAVTGIIVAFKSIYNLWTPSFKIIHFFWQLTAVGISAQLFVLPLSVYYFHQIPIYSVLSGLLVVPFAAVILYATITLLLSSYINMSLASGIGVALSCVIEFQNKFIFLIQKIPYHSIQGVWLEWYEVLLIYGFVISVLLLIRTKIISWLQIALCCVSLFLGVRAWQLVGSYQQQELVIYALYEDTIIDFIDGRKLVSWQSNNVDKKTIDFNIQPNRWERCIQEQEVITPNDFFESGGLYVDKSYFQFGDRRLVLVDSTFVPVMSKVTLDCNYALVRDNPNVSMKEVIAIYQMDLVIFDGTNTRYKVKQWKKECKELGIAYYDIKEQGAFIDNVTRQTFSSVNPRISSK